MPLQGLDVSRDIDAIIDAHVRTASRNSDCLPKSPLEWLREETKPLLLIFDGLDEVARQDNGADLDITRKFLESLRFWLSQTNGNQEPKVMAVVLGRPAAAEDAARELSDLDSQRLLYVEPLCKLDKEQLWHKDQDKDRLRHELNEEIEIIDPKGLAKDDHRKQLWCGYARFDDRYGDKEPEALKERGFDDLTSEPLLLYLLMYSGLAGERWPEAKENRNRIYQAIFAKVHGRDKKEKNQIAVDDEGDFFTLMECLGLAAWQGGGRTGSDSNFMKIRDEIYAPEKEKTFRNLDRAQLKNVAVQFYTHQGTSQDGYGFIHKSFSEYLTARALVNASAAWCEHYGKRNRWDSFAEDWLRLTGGQRLTQEILTFMIDEARLRVKSYRVDEAATHKAQTLVEQLTEVAALILRQGFPAHKVLPFSMHDADWRLRELNQSSAELALYGVIHAWAEAGYVRMRTSRTEASGEWLPGVIKVVREKEASKWAAAMLWRLNEQSSTDNLVGRLLARWDLSHQRLGSIGLIGFDFYGAKLSEANLCGAILHEADLRKADLRRADLRGAELQRAALDGANLQGANLFVADLTRAKLGSACLEETYLRGATLCGADLSNTNLVDTNLVDANLDDANLSGAKLHGADLSDAINLRQSQINEAFGNLKTKLPDGVDRPHTWQGMVRRAH